MIETVDHSSAPELLREETRKDSGERGAALATAVLLLALMGAIAMTVLAVVRTETSIAASDLAEPMRVTRQPRGLKK